MQRKSGVLMHVTSLPGKYGSGTFGIEAFNFIDRLKEGGFSLWQTLPFCMPDGYGSPYSSYSAFSGNPFLIDPDTLVRKGYLRKDEVLNEIQESPWLCDFEKLNETRIPLLRLAAKRALADPFVKKEVEAFCKANPEIAQFCHFMALKTANNGEPWFAFTTEKIDPEEEAAWQFMQYEFSLQWAAVRQYANQNGISLIGDIPIYVAYDSSDVYENLKSGIFDLDEDGRRKNVAGVPPDFFAEEGQLWGNPLYQWKVMKQDGFAWWKARLRHLFSQFDGVRIDHFRGFESYWSIPASAKTAKEGAWVKGPGRAIVDKIKEIADGRLIIAEDLGDITPEVERLLKYSKFPGMRVFQFAFLGDRESPHLPHNHIKNCIAYTGTHDNNTLLGYVWEMDAESRRQVFEYCNCETDDWNRGCVMIIKTMMASHSDTVIFPIQDIFVYGADTRMNTPGTSESNWAYRMTREQLFRVDREKFARLNTLYGR